LERVAAAEKAPIPRYLLERLLLDTSGYLVAGGLRGVTPPLEGAIQAARQRLAEAGLPVPAVEAVARYQWVGEVTQGVVVRSDNRPKSFTDRLDRILTHRWWGTLFFLFVMLVMFESVFRLGDYASGWIEMVKERLSDFATFQLPEGAVRSLAVNGIIEGVGGVVTFLPQIFILFFFIAAC
jgi:ferrous iron transport protein B